MGDWIRLAKIMNPTDYRQLLAYSDDDLGKVDPVVSNLLVAKSIPALAHLDISRFQLLRDQWVGEFRAWLPQAEAYFQSEPEYFRDDIKPNSGYGQVIGCYEKDLQIAPPPRPAACPK